MSVATYLNQTVKWLAKSGNDKFGKPKNEDAVTIKCRIKGSSRRMLDENGKEFNADIEMWVLPNQEMSLDDLIIWDETNYRVVNVKELVNFSGKIDHKKVLLILVA